MHISVYVCIYADMYLCVWYICIYNSEDMKYISGTSDNFQKKTTISFY